MKRAELIRSIRDGARAAGVAVELARDDGDHEWWVIDGLGFSVPASPGDQRTDGSVDPQATGTQAGQGVVAMSRMRYTAIAERSGRWWALHVPAVPGVFTQSRTLKEARSMVRSAVSLALECPPDSFDVDLEVRVSADGTSPAAVKRHGPAQGCRGEGPGGRPGCGVGLGGDETRRDRPARRRPDPERHRRTARGQLPACPATDHRQPAEPRRPAREAKGAATEGLSLTGGLARRRMAVALTP